MKSEVMLSAKTRRLRKFLWVAPILILPFVILLLWTVGLVGDARAGVQGASKPEGMNLNLPAAAPAKDSNWNKLRYYEQAEKDSQKLRMQLKNDPFFRNMASDDDGYHTMDGISEYAERLYGNSRVNESSSAYSDPNERMVYERLSRLQEELYRTPEPDRSELPTPTIASPETKQLENMMHQMQVSAEDPELSQLDQMLDKIIAIQNPETVKEELRAVSEKRRAQVFGVQTDNEILPISTLETLPINADTAHSNGFFSVDNFNTSKANYSAVEAVVHETQTVINGATVKLRLADDIYINGVLIPKETFVYGMATINGERLKVIINSIRYKSQLLPVQLSVYDLDGVEGIRVPGAISREVVQQSTDRGLQRLGFTTVSPSVGLQAASLGVEAAKSFLSKKVKLVRVTVKAGYQVLLKDEKQKDQ